LVGSTLVGNQANGGQGASGGTLANCISYYNYGFSQANYSAATLNYCCTTPLPAGGAGNITNAPLFVNIAGGDFRLQNNSPCINAGKNSYVTTSTDLGGNSRIRGGTVDMGAYEFQSPGSLLSHAWAQQYGLATDGSADHADADQDGMDNWQEWVAGTNPTNSLSVLKVLSLSNSSPGVKLTWQSVTNRSYYIQRATNLAMDISFSTIYSNVPGLAGSTSVIDTNAPPCASGFYRVGVQ